MHIETNLKGLIYVGALIGFEAYLIAELSKRYVKQCKRASKAERERDKYKAENDLFEIANKALSREIDELEKKLES